ncbi:MAG TPA: tRNA (adenosine(37)-N6)-threonylcarbamoyltransferase complex ATPase subunit type 1 TsaE [Phycisphaerae bacterium]|nr:tRNA (adenosine(37)-N6)-threonylcarbamoyltransferase complex ATPase subunit type 1 TsaE [Phycisphaerae bacterium]
MSRMTLTSDSIEATHAIGRQLGAGLACGHIIALVGPLGSGKTALVKGIAQGAGVADLRQVNSPTFVIVNEYDGSPAGVALRIYHVDAYRLRGPGDLDALGFDEMCAQGAVIVEWADRVEGLLPSDCLTLRIDVLDGDSRRFLVSARGPSSGNLIADLRPPEAPRP